MDPTAIKSLIDLGAETERLDYKVTFNWNSAVKEDKCQIVKDILAFANTSGGGHIVFGVRDGDAELVGMSGEDYLSFDPTVVGNFLKQYADPMPTVDIWKTEINDKRVVVLQVAEFSSTPIICKKDMQLQGGKSILLAGTIYIRNSSAESIRIENSDQMRELLNRAIKVRSDEILRDIRRVMEGRQIVSIGTDVFDSSRKVAHEQIEKNFAGLLKINGVGTLTLTIIPSQDLTGINADTFKLRSRLKASKVAARGWEFPYLNEDSRWGKIFNIEDGFTSYTAFSHFAQTTVALLNGLLVWRSAMWEDLIEGASHSGQKVMSFIGIIYQTLEFVAFVNRFYDYGDTKPDISIELSVTGLAGRRIVSYEPGVLLWNNYESEVDVVVIRPIPFGLVDSIAEPKRIATQLARGVFEIFNYDIGADVIESWQNKYLSGRL